MKLSSHNITKYIQCPKQFGIIQPPRRNKMPRKKLNLAPVRELPYFQILFALFRMQESKYEWFDKFYITKDQSGIEMNFWIPSKEAKTGRTLVWYNCHTNRIHGAGLTKKEHKLPIVRMLKRICKRLKIEMKLPVLVESAL